MTLVQTQFGKVQGERRAAHHVFRGIPYAKPPVGALRFRAPEPPEPWTGVRSALTFGPSSLQARSGPATDSVPQPCSEDCLYLNVYTPATDAARRPVFFWIHGGAFVVGAGGEELYDGGRLAERGDVVVVTINYRLGALGFCHWSESDRANYGVTSNAGMLDQIAALRWVQGNIAAFGGDPNAITIAGESAGAYSVAMLLCMPAARGLYQRAIAQSGARLSRGSGDPDRATRALLRALELPPRRIEELWKLPADRILAAQSLTTGGLARAAEGGTAFAPVHDGDTLPLPLDHAVPRGETARVPLVIGSNRDEMNLFLGAALKKLDDPISEDACMQQLRALLPDAADARLLALFELYRRTRTARHLPASDRALLAAIRSDGLWRVPSQRFAEAYQRHQPATFQYFFTYESPAMRGALRSCHGLELPFVFGTFGLPSQLKFAGSGEAAERLSARMMDAWLAFTRSGDPSLAADGGNWPAYDLQRRPMMVFDRDSRRQDAPYEDERAAWDDLSPRAL
jgi:para-nitrobenzyl esterase